MPKIIINTCHGGFHLSELAISKYSVGKNLSNEELDRIQCGDTTRTDAFLVEIVEELGEEASEKPLSKLKVVDVPDDVEWQLEEYDGKEWIAECHRTWH